MLSVRRLVRCVSPLSALLFAAAPASAKTHALLVGIGSYKYASEEGEFRNLKGAANDVASIRAVLERKYRLPSDALRTLVDAKATRQEILENFSDLISKSDPGDQLIFYYSGHGALLSEGFAGGGDEADRVDETIVPYDSRGPEGITDIRDDELRTLISAASRRGVNVITIFDSCNSGSATRGGTRNVRGRAAPPATAGGPPPPNPTVPQAASAAQAPGFRVHLASARDGEMALEAEENGRWRGDFTAALVSALEKLPAGASYKDVLAEVRLQLTEAGLGRQHPRGEGELNRSFLGTRPVERRVFEVTRGSGGSWQLHGGAIAGVLPASKFAVFGNSTDASGATATPLAKAIVVSSTATSATVEIPGLSGTEQKTLFAREIERKFAPSAVRLAIRGFDAASAADLRKRVAAVPAVQLVDRNPQLVLVAEGSRVMVQDPDGVSLASFSAQQMQSAPKILGSYFALLQLRDAGAQPAVNFGLELVDCGTDEACAAPTPLGPVPQDPSGEYRLQQGQSFRLTMTSREAKMRNVYLLQLGGDFRIDLFYPGENESRESDSQLTPGKPVVVPDIFDATEPGRDYFMLIATERPIDLSVLQQDGLRSAATSLDPLSQLLQTSRQATRGAPAVVPVDNWGVKLVSAITEAKRPQ